jgi:hypothetical protein
MFPESGNKMPPAVYKKLGRGSEVKQDLNELMQRK